MPARILNLPVSRANRKGRWHCREVVSSHLAFHFNLEGAFHYGERELDPKSTGVRFGRNPGWTFRFSVATSNRNGAASWSASQPRDDAGGCGASERPHPAEFSSHGGSRIVRRQSLVRR